MKLLLFVLFITVQFAQDTNFIVEGSFITIPRIIDRLPESLTNLLDPAVNDVGGLLMIGPNFDLSNLATSVLGTVFNMIDNLISLLDGLLTKARSSGKLVDDCLHRTTDFELLKQTTSNAVDNCTKNFDAVIANFPAELKEEQDHRKDVISSLTQSLQNCLKGLFVTSCISNVQQSSLKEIQEIINNVEGLRQRMVFASDELKTCSKNVEENGLAIANKIYREIEKCISQAPHTFSV